MERTLEEAASVPQRGPRHPWIDNLRVVMIGGVIAAHVSITYVLDYDWYYEERTGSAVTQVVLAPFVGVGLLFGMGLLFFLAGMLSSTAIERKGPGRFAVDRAVRLGLPLVVYVVLIEPLNDYIGDLPDGMNNPWTYYVDWWRHGGFAVGVMWFVAVLLVFSLAFAAWRWGVTVKHGRSLPTVQGLGVAVAVMTALSFLVRLVSPFGSDTFLDLNLWESPQMVVMFALGTIAGDRRWFADGLPRGVRRRCQTLAGSGLVVLAAAGLLSLPLDVDEFLGGAHPQAFAFALAEALIAVGTSLWIAASFQRRWDHAAPLMRHLGRASFGAYVVHTPVIVGLAVAASGVATAVEVKFVFVLVCGIVMSFALGWLASRAPGIRRII